MGLPTYAARVIFKYERSDKSACKEYLGRIFVYQILFSGIGGLLSLLFAEQIFHLLLGDMSLPKKILFYIPIMSAFLLSLNGFMSNNLLSLQLNKRIFYLEMTDFMLFVPGQIIGLSILKFTVWDVIILQLVVQAIVLFVGLGLMKDWMTFSLKKLGIFKEAMKYSLPMVPMNFVSWIQDRIDRILLNRMISLSAVGVYTTGISIATQYSFISRPIANTLTPEISKRLDSNDPNIQSDIKDLFMFFCQVSIYLYLAISLLSKEVVTLILNVRFYECYKIIPIILLSIIFLELTGIFNLKIIFKNKTIWYPVIYSVSTALNVLLNVLLIPAYDIYGAALAKTIATLLGMYLAYYISQRLHRSEYHLYKNAIPLVAVIGIIYVVNLCNIQLWPLLILKVCIILAYAIGLDCFLKRYNVRYYGLRMFFINTAVAMMKRSIMYGSGAK